ncbi:MAG: hypothetical protein E3J86_04985 [Candidatus Thorarchaeota archaeon]|nr:MAG: hypothetical protein E3J86_04985 [Candidatus Thorarchaeota archaeon]
MNQDNISTEIELYGVSPGIIAMIMFFVTIFSPFSFIPNMGMFGFYNVHSGIYGLFWIFANPYIFLPLCLLNLLYSYWIVKYYQAKSSKDGAILIGLFSILLPTVIVLSLTGLFGSFLVIYPIPIQFIVGLIILWRIEVPEVISPWSGMRLDLSWWKWERPKRKSDWDPFKEEKKALENEDSVNSE